MSPDGDPAPSVAPRSEALVARFREIAEGVRELPFYNERLAVEAVGFRPFGDGILGVLVTPWFMNLMLLPKPPESAVDWNRIGHKRLVQLPRGPRDFRYAGDEVLGAYWSHSLHSPMSAFNDPVQARQAARAALAALLAPEAAAAGAPRRPDRRAFLGARLPGSG